MLISLLTAVALATAPFAVNTNSHADPEDFRVTTFATGLLYPTSMQQLSDGSIIVGVGTTDFYNSASKILRLVDTDDDGVADGSPTVLASGLPAGITSIRVVGELVVVNHSSDQTIAIYRVGATPSDPLTFVDDFSFTFPASQWHESYALAIQELGPAEFDLYWNFGSRYNNVNDTATVTASGLVSGSLASESIWAVTITDDGTDVAVSDLRQIASGLRNAAGIAFAANGDLWFQDNGIDGPMSGALSADELNTIASSGLGGAIEDFGFASTYTEYRTGTEIGSAGILPELVFQPIPTPNGSENEGAVEIAFAPSGFPAGLNAGIFVGFHGKFNDAGLLNEENPLAYADPSTGEVFHFISNDETGIGHPNGLLATADSLFVADLTSTGSMFSSSANGKLYQIKYDPDAIDPCPGDDDTDEDGICDDTDPCPDDAGNDADSDGYCAPEDCNDANAAINPLATEVCDGVDDDCDGSTERATACASTCGNGTVEGTLSGLPACPNPTSFTTINSLASLNAWRANPVTGANLTAAIMVSGDVELLTQCDVKSSAAASLTGASSLFIAGRNLTMSGPLSATGPILLRGSTKAETKATASLTTPSFSAEAPTVTIASDASGAGLCAEGGKITITTDANWLSIPGDPLLYATESLVITGDLAGSGTLDLGCGGAFTQPVGSVLSGFGLVDLDSVGNATLNGVITGVDDLDVHAARVTLQSGATWAVESCTVAVP